MSSKQPLLCVLSCCRLTVADITESNAARLLAIRAVILVASQEQCSRLQEQVAVQKEKISKAVARMRSLKSVGACMSVEVKKLVVSREDFVGGVDEGVLRALGRDVPRFQADFFVCLPCKACPRPQPFLAIRLILRILT